MRSKARTWDIRTSVCTIASSRPFTPISNTEWQSRGEGAKGECRFRAGSAEIFMTATVKRTERRPWVPAAVLVAIVYCAVGVVFQGPFAWRLAAWLVCAAAYVVHLAFEHFRLRNSPRLTALHAAAAVALGIFGLAVAATIHRAFSAVSGADFRLYAIALVAWPILTALPAFVVGLIITSAIGRFETDT